MSDNRYIVAFYFLSEKRRKQKFLQNISNKWKNTCTEKSRKQFSTNCVATLKTASRSLIGVLNNYCFNFTFLPFK